VISRSLWEATEARRHTVPAWLGQALIELATSSGGPPRGGASALSRMIVDIVSYGEEVDAASKPRVFCGFDFAAEVAIEIAAAGLEADLDLQNGGVAAICQCISFAENLKLRVRCGDPVELARAGKEMRGGDPWPSHDIAIVIPPFNDKSRATEADTLGTGLPRAANSESVGVTLALARGREIAICVVPPSFLFQTSKANQVFKEYAIADFGLDTVASLPGGIFQFSAIAAGLLLFKPSTAQKCISPESRTVFMVAALGERDRPAIGSGLTDGIGKVIRDHEITVNSSLVTIRDIAANDFVLQPERYIENPEAQRLRELEASSTLIPLEDLVEFLRPQAVRKAQDDDTVAATYIEVAVADLDEVGRVRRPTKQVSVSRDSVIQTRRALLKPADIILVIKGSVGKVGLVRDMPDDAETNWIASQSFVILRLRQRAPIQDPRVLFRYLSSPLGLAKLQNLSVGTTVPGLQMAALQRLSIAVPPIREQREIGRQMDELFAIQDQIDGLRAKVGERQQAIWPSS
jgi:type I restriction enzyme M protein